MKSKKKNKNAKMLRKTKKSINKKRFLGEIAIFEIILCIFVIMIHLCSEPLDNFEKGGVISTLFFFVNKIISFAVSGFIFSSGLKLFYNLKSVSYFKFISHRITKIYFPYIFWVCAYYLFFVYYMKYFDFSIKDLLKYIEVGDLVAHFYFILIIMQFYLLFPLIKLYVNKIHAGLGIIIAVFITVVSKACLIDFAYNDRVFLTYFIFFILGCYVGKSYELSLRFLNQVRYGIYLLALGFGFAYVSCSYSEFLGVSYYEFTEVLKIFFCIFMFLSMFVLIANRKSVNRWSESSAVKLVGASTFYVYLIHCMLIFIAEHELTRFGVASIILRFAVKFVFVYAGSFLSCVVYVKFKQCVLGALSWRDVVRKPRRSAKRSGAK